MESVAMPAVPAGLSRRTPVALARLAEETRCPVCFGILKQTVTSTVCLHRFCAACIDTCLAGRPPLHKECPVCRTNLHSRRALRPDPNFDLLLKALYGDVVTYGQQEDALVAATNQAHSQHTVEMQEAWRAVRQAQEAAVAVCRPCVNRRVSGSGRAGCAGPSAASPATGMSCQPSNAGSDSNGAGVTTMFAKRSRDSCNDAASRAPAGCPSSDTTRAPETSTAKRHHSLHRSMSVGRGDAAAAAAAPGRPPHQPARAASRPHALQLPTPGPAPAGDSAGNGCGSPPGAGTPSRTPSRSQHPQPSRERPEEHPPPHPRHRPSVPGAGVGPGSPSAAGSHGGGGSGGGRGGGGGCGSGAAGGDAGVVPPRGPLAVPTARTASELSLRHAGMVVVQLRPYHGSGGGSDGGGGGLTNANGRAVRVVPLPPLEKPFLLCPAKWSLAHICQLLSQWLPPRGYGPATAPMPPAAIHLEAPPGMLRGSHRCLQGCMTIGSLASELVGEEQQLPGGRGGAEQRPEHLVLLYSVVPQ